jgi:hypothetical protein
MKGVENVLIPIPNWNQFKEGGGAGGMIEWWPVDQVIKVLEGSFTARKQLIDDVFQITGISDIVRGEAIRGRPRARRNSRASGASVRIRDRIRDGSVWQQAAG